MANAITEGVAGLWHYHFAPEERQHKALCGATTMRSGLNPEDWGKRFGEHFPKRPTWCAECARIVGISPPVKGGEK